MSTSSPAQGVRARVRAEMRASILDTARRHLAQEGASGLSLRAVARELGMASSAVYRYFPNRDALLTALIIDAYDSLGAAVEAAEATVPRADLLGRWVQIARSVRGWALEHPTLYALVYGSPVPGYAAPQDTVGPATRVSRLLTTLLLDTMRAHGPGGYATGPVDGDYPTLSKDAVEGLAPAIGFMGPPATSEWSGPGSSAPSRSSCSGSSRGPCFRSDARRCSTPRCTARPGGSGCPARTAPAPPARQCDAIPTPSTPRGEVAHWGWTDFVQTFTRT